MLQNFLTPIKINEIVDLKKLSVNQWGHQVAINDGNEELEWQGFRAAILGLNFDDENEGDTNCASAPDLIRSEFYKLFNWERNMQLIDLGNLNPGSDKKNTYDNLATVVEMLLEQNVFPIIIGGTHDYTYGQFMAYERQEIPINLVVVDETIDLQHPELGKDSKSFLYKILAHQPNFITNFFHLCHQHYLVDPEMVDTLEKFHFSCFRLGEFKENIKRLEPLVRNADMVSIDLSSLRYSDAPGQLSTSPHGLTGEEACALTRYIGFGDKVSSLGLFEYFPSNDNNRQTARLAAQMLWYFIDGFTARRYDYPQLFTEDFLNYKVPLEETQKIEFVKSKNDEKWWMKVPVMNGTEVERIELVPCAYEDYLKSIHYKEVPERWLKHFIRLSK